MDILRRGKQGQMDTDHKALADSFCGIALEQKTIFESDTFRERVESSDRNSTGRAGVQQTLDGAIGDDI